MAKVSAIDKYLKEQQKKEEQQRKQQLESQNKALQSASKTTNNQNTGVSDSIKNLLKKQQEASNKNNTSFLTGTQKKQEEIKPVQIQKNVPERSFLTGNQEQEKVVKTSEKKNLKDYNFNIGEYRKAEQDNYKKNKEIALQDEALQSILAMDQTKERDAAKDKYMQDTNLAWRLNELRNKNHKTVAEEDELAQLEHKLLELNNLRRANDTLVDDAILDAAGVVSNTYNSAAYNADLLLQSIFNPQEKLVETRNADLINQIASGRENTAQILNDNHGPLAGFLYQSALSMSDVLAQRVLDMFIPGAGLLTMASNAAASKALDIGSSEEDATAFEQLGRGIISGGIEYATEKISWDALNEVLGSKNARSVLTGMFNQAREEGREEVLSTFMNGVIDNMFGANKDITIDELLQAYAGGAISGGVMGGGATYANNKAFDGFARNMQNNYKVQQAFKDYANIEDITTMPQKDFSNLLANTLDDMKKDIGEEAYNKMDMTDLIAAIPNYMTAGEKNTWQTGNVLDFQQALQNNSNDPFTSMLARNNVKARIKAVAEQYNLDKKTVQRFNNIVNNTGLNIVFTEDMKGKKADGLYENGTLYINPNGEKTYMHTLKHELGHEVARNDSFKEIKNYLIAEYENSDLSLVRENGVDRRVSFNEKVKMVKGLYAAQGIDLTTQDAEEEVVCDLVFQSKLFEGGKALSKLTMDHTDYSLREKFADFFGNMAKRFKGDSDYVKELDHMRDLFVDALKKDNLFNKADANNVKYAIKEDEFGKYVEIDTDIFKENNVSRKKRKKFLRDYIQKNLKLKIKNDNTNAILKTNEESTKYASPNIRETEVYLKGRLIGNMNEVFKIAEYDHWEAKQDKETNRNAKIGEKGFDYYNFRIALPKSNGNFDYYQMTLLINKQKDGDFLYDVKDIEKISGNGHTEMSGEMPNGNSFSRDSENSLTQEEQKSTKNTSFSISSQRRKDLLSMHNLSASKLANALDLGGLVMPSIAVTKDSIPHDNFGDITIVTDKSSIDPADRRNKVYSRDAWTPTFPRVDYHVDYDSVDTIERKLNGIVPDLQPLRNASTSFSRLFDTDNIADLLSSYDGDLVEAFENEDVMKYVYLMSKNKDIAVPYQEKQSGYGNDAIKYVIDKKGKDWIDSAYWAESEDKPVKETIDIINEHYEIKYGQKNFYDNDSFADADSILRDAYKMAFGQWNKSQRIDKNKLANIVKDVNQEDYQAWLNDLFSDVAIDKGIRNKKDLFKPSGKRRSFKELHEPFTAENILKSMLSETQIGKVGFGSGLNTVIAGKSKEFGSIEDIINSESNLKPNDEAYEQKYNTLKEKFDLLSADADKVYKWENGFQRLEDYASAGVEIAKLKKPTTSSIIRIFNKYDFDVDNDFASDYLSLINEINDLSTDYFEAKPQRIIKPDEWKQVYIPNTTDANLRQRLLDLGVEVIEYNPKVKGDKQNKINSNAIDYKFSISPKEINLKNVSSVIEELTQNDKTLMEKAISINSYYMDNEKEMSMFAKNRMKRLVEMYAAGFDERKEYDDFKQRVNMLTRISDAKEMLDEVHNERAELHNSGITKGDEVVKLNSKEQMINKALDRLIQFDTSNYDRTPVEVKPVTREQQATINRLDHIKYKYNGNNEIHVEAFGTRGDLEAYGNYTKEQLDFMFGPSITNQIIESVDETTKELYDFEKNHSLNQDADYVNSIVKSAEKSVGLTSNTNEVGYIDINGKMLDFSGKREGGPSNVRNMDHREIPGVIFDDFVDMGNIRMFPESGGFELIHKPNAKQQKALLNYLKNNDYAKTNGSFIGISSNRDSIGRYDVASLIFENGEKPEQIMKELMSYFPSESSIKYSISSKYTNDLKDIMKKYGSLQMRNAQEVDSVLSDIAKEIATTGDFAEDNKNALMKLIRENVMASRDDNNGEIYQEIKKQFGGTKLYVDSKYENFLKRHNLRNRLRGLFTLTSDKANADYSIDSFYNELVENYNGVFEQLDTEEDQLLELAEKLKEIKADNRKMQPIGETNEYFFSEEGVIDDINKYLNNMKSRINQMPDAVKNRVSDVYTLLNAERFVEKNTRLQNFNKYYFNNINEEAVRTLGVYTKRSENTQKLFQDAIQEVAEGGDITNKTRDALINDLVSHLDKTNEIKLDEYTEQQMKFFKADTDSTFKSIVKDELNNLIRDVQFAMAYADGELLDDKAIKAAQTRYEKQLREETRNTKVKMASEIVGRTPQEQLKQMGVFDVLQTKESFDKTNAEFDNGIAEGDDVGQITGLDAAMINELRENGVDKTSFNKTLSQVFDVMAGKSPRLREMLRACIERPLDNAKKRMFDDQKHNLEKLSKAMKQYGIKAGSKESKAVQWYGEGTKDVNDPEAKPYTLVDLQQEFPNKWQDIVAFEKFCRQMYDDYFERVNRARQSIYPNPLDQAYVDLANAQERVNKYERIIASSKANNIYDENFITKQYHNLERAKDDVQRITEAINNGDYTLNKVLPKRKDYFHHFQEIAVEHGNVLKIINNPNDYKISNKLSGLSEGTKPKAKFTGFMQHREHAEYEADAVGGLLKYIPVAEYAIHIDPQTAHLRGIIKAMRDTSNADDTDLAYTINYLTHFANNLAGKTFILDRIVTDVIPGGRKVMQALKAINSRVKGNAILGNVRSAISQFYNLPTGLSMIKNPASMAKGAMQYARYLKGEKNAVDIMNQSSFLQERYFDKVYNELDLNDDSQIKKMATYMMQFGDEVISRNIWFGAYEDAIAQNMNQQEAIGYADNLTRSAVAGRGIGEVPLLQQSEVIKLFAPFQVEVNNQWQYLKQLTNDVVSGGPDEKKKAAWQMFIMFAVTWGMNELRERFLDGNRTGMDLVDAFIDVFNSVNEGDVSFTTTAGRVGGEVLSNMPYASQLTPLLLDETQSEALFGDADPTRFGTQNIGFSGLLSPLVQAAQGKDVDVQGLAFDYLTPWGGSQLDRTIGYMQDRGWIPDLKVNTKEGISLEQNEVAGSYADNGRLRYALDEEDVPETIRGLLFGTTGTQAAREYYDNGAKSLSDAKTQAYVEARKAGATYKEMDGVMNDITKFESLKDTDGDSITYSKGKQTADYIDDLSMNAKAKETLFKTYALSETQREVYDKAIAAGGTYNQLKDAMFDIAMMESLKDSNGKSISNSKALQTAKYINELNVSEEVKDVLRDEYLSKTVKEMSMGEVYGRLKNLGVGGTSSTSSYRSSSSKKTSVPSVSSRIKTLLSANSSNNNDFNNRLKQIIKEFENKSKVR